MTELTSEEALPHIGLAPCSLSIIVPSRNERNNVATLLERITTILSDTTHEIIFVDDSDDGTEQILNALATEQYPNLRVVHRRPGARFDGLSGAIFDGIDLAEGEYIAVLDADLQHPPELLADMIGNARLRDVDVVIASRYVAGGSSDGLDGWSRRAISKASALVCRVLFHERIRSIKDPCSGFFLVRRSLLNDVRLRPIGFKILLEILMRTEWSTVHETPYRFAERTGGKSKATFSQGVTFLKHCLRLLAEVPRVGRLWKFAAVGGSGFIVNMVALWFLAVVIDLPRFPSWALSTELAVLSNFTFNRWFTWSDRAASGLWKIVAQGARYHMAIAAGLASNGAIFWLTSQAGFPVLLSGMAGVLSGAVANFLFCSGFVFPTGDDEAKQHEEFLSAPTESAPISTNAAAD